MLLKLNMFLLKKDFPIEVDYIISLGNACRPAYWLSYSNLRLCSNPLDWMMNYNLEIVVRLFQSRFKDFFKNRKYIYYKDTPSKLYGVKDLDTKMLAIHSFHDEAKDAVAYPQFLTTMTNRFERMDSFIKQSNSIAFLCNHIKPLNDFQTFLAEMSKLYPKQKFILINVYHSIIYRPIKIVRIDSKFKIIQLYFRDIRIKYPRSKTSPAAWKGNEQEWINLCQHITLSNKLDAVSVDSRSEDKQQM